MMISQSMKTWTPPDHPDQVLLEKGYGLSKSRRWKRPARMMSDDSSICETWMSRLDDDIFVSSLSIPGTHDSAAFTRPWPFISTQKMDILQQLNAGIRYFDLRCGLRDNIAEMVHGPSLLGLTLSDVLDTMYSWLDVHPREGIVVQVKEDREPERSTVKFFQAIFGYISVQSARWRTANTTPLLGDLRGKIQLFRRFRGPNLYAYGIDVTAWQDNPSTPFTITTRHCVQLTIQDHYSFSDPKSLPDLISSKGRDVSELLDRASSDQNAGHWYLNFTSAYEFNWWYQLTPRQIAVGGYFGFAWEDGMNPRLCNFLRERPGVHRYGIVAMDFPELGSDDLIATLIQTNFKPKKKKPVWRVFVSALLILVLVLVWVVLLWMDQMPEGSIRWRYWPQSLLRPFEVNATSLRTLVSGKSL